MPTIRTKYEAILPDFSDFIIFGMWNSTLAVLFFYKIKRLNYILATRFGMLSVVQVLNMFMIAENNFIAAINFEKISFQSFLRIIFHLTLSLLIR